MRGNLSSLRISSGSETILEHAELGEHDQIRLAAILDEYLIASEEGRPISRAQCLAANPDLAAVLSEYFDNLQILNNLARRHPTAPIESSANYRQLSDYELGDEIGRGSMGIVYRAVQKSLGREVALKVLSFSGALNEDRVARFHREAHITAALDHPGVVKVFDVGCEAGTHYYAMQLIDGLSLDRHIEWARRQSMPTQTVLAMYSTIDGMASPLGSASVTANESMQTAQAQLLVGPNRFRSAVRLIQSAALAMHAAHLAGIVHRDLKPSNLIVDRQGNLKVTDFGLARLDQASKLTHSGDLIGTLRYMSPEQAAGRGTLIDPRTDVYALGATLYELCTLQPAYPGEDYPSLIQAICRGEPVPPRRIEPSIPADLQTIILKAMCCEQADRYPTASALAEDLDRFLAGKTILARPRGVYEKVLAWGTRYTAVLFTALLVVTAGLIGTLFHVSVLSIETKRTEQAVRTADEMFRHARAAVDSLGARVASQLTAIPNAQAIRREILNQTLAYYEEFVKKAEQDASLATDVAETKLQIARLVKLFGNFDDSVAAYQVAIHALSPANLSLTEHAGTVWCMAVNEQAMLFTEHGHHSRALELLQQIELAKVSDRAAAVTYNNLGVAQLRLGQTTAALESVQKAVQLMESRAEIGYADEDPWQSTDLADSMNNLCVLLDAAGQSSAALSIASHILKLRTQTPQNVESDWRSLERLAAARSTVAALNWKSGQAAQAVDDYREATRLLELASKNAPSLVSLRRQLAVTLNNLGMAATSHGDHPMAQAALQRAEKIADAEFQSDTSNAETASHLAGIQNNLGVLLNKMNLQREARQMFTRAVKHQTIAVELAPDSIPYRRSLEQVRLALSARDSK